MKHCEKCHLEKYLGRLKVKKMGILGVVLMGAHVLFHVVECLILPSILVALGGHLAEEPAAAVEQSESAMISQVEAQSGAKNQCGRYGAALRFEARSRRDLSWQDRDDDSCLISGKLAPLQR